MNRITRFLIVIALLCGHVVAQGVSQTEDKDIPDVVKRTQTAAEVFEAIMEAPDSGIPAEILDAARCVAITPSMFKAGIGSVVDMARVLPAAGLPMAGVHLRHTRLLEVAF
jgi:hypothetical protein